MISHEFPIGNCSPETDAEFLDNLAVTVRSMLREYRNHPSIVEFVGGNEMSWNSTSRHPALQLMQKLAAAETDQLFRATCPDAGARTARGCSTSAAPTAITMRCRRCVTASSAVVRRPIWRFGIATSRWLRSGPSTWMIRCSSTDAVQAVFNRNMWSNKADVILGVPSAESGRVCSRRAVPRAEGLRYAFDALRRKGRRIGGMTNHCYSEPWPNAAGSGLVDFDGAAT